MSQKILLNEFKDELLALENVDLRFVLELLLPNGSNIERFILKLRRNETQI